FELQINLAQHYYMRKRRDEVVRVLENLKSHSKEYPEAFDQVGAFYFRLGDGAEAIRQYEEGEKANPDKKATYQKMIIEVLMAQVQLSRREFDAAIKTANDALAYDKLSVPAHLIRASSYMGQNQMSQAKDELKQILTINPNSQDAMIQMGVVLANEKKFKEAE